MSKETYLTHSNIADKAQQYMRELTKLRRRHIQFDRQAAALLVLDMQDYFLLPSSHAYVPSALAIIEGIDQLIDTFLKHDRPVIATQHLNTPDDASMMAVWWRDLLNGKIARSHFDKKNTHFYSVTKTQYDAFHNTALKQLLTALNVSQLVITGVMTHLCCETTARSAFVHGFQVFFTVDGTASYTEAFHKASLLTLSHGVAVPVTTGEITKAYD